MASTFSTVLSGLVTGLTNVAGSAVATAPAVQQPLADLQAEYEKMRTWAIVAGCVAGAVVLFYYLPRFESPVPRIFRD
jgi:type VI protein secretion system component VasF